MVTAKLFTKNLDVLNARIDSFEIDVKEIKDFQLKQNSRLTEMKSFTFDAVYRELADRDNKKNFI